MDFQSIYGSRLHTYRYPTSCPKGLLVIVHGMHYHSNSYAHYAKRFAQDNFIVIAFDQQFHGLSEGQRGEIISMFDFAEDTKNFIEKAHGNYPKLPLFVLGESMGGFVAVVASMQLSETRLSGLILLSPALGVEPNYERCLRRLLRCFACTCP